MTANGPLGPGFDDPAVMAVFDAMDGEVRHGLLGLRDLIFDVAAGDPRVGRVHETLKWGQPSYVTQQTNSGTTLRMGPTKSGDIGMFVHCQSRPIAANRE